MPKIPMLGIRLFDPDDNCYKLAYRLMAHLVRLRQAKVEAAKSLSLKELDELVKKLPDHEVDRIDRRVSLIRAARAKLSGAGHLKTDDRNALRALADGAGRKIILQRQLSCLRMQGLHVDHPLFRCPRSCPYARPAAAVSPPPPWSLTE